ncbi:MAG: apolipoprotein N-acyltransferase [Spirochaetales bacterium]
MNLFLSIVSGCLFPLGLPNDYFLYGNPWIGSFSLTPFFLALYRAKSPKEGMALSALFGCFSTFLSNYWLMFFKDYAFLTIGSVTLAYTGVYALWGAIFWKSIHWDFLKVKMYHPIGIALSWTVFEYFKSIGYLGYPWSLSPYPFNQALPLLQIADLGGIWVLSFCVAYGNATLALALSEIDRQTLFPNAAFWLSTVLIFLLYGFYRMNHPIPLKGYLRTVLVQQNMDPWQAGKETENLRSLIYFSRKGIEQLEGKVDLVVWSESSVSRPVSEYTNYFRRNPPEEPFFQFLKNTGTYFLIGNPVVTPLPDGSKGWQNGAILLNSTGTILDTYGKQHPVPMAEHIPFYEVPWVKKFFQEVIGLGGIWTLGEKDTIFSVPTQEGKLIQFGAPICFEDAFFYLCRRFILSGADLWINLTNDSWSRRESAQVQHLVVARFRSIEMKRTLIRCTNGGVTAVIGPFGEILADLPMFQATALAVKVPVFKEDTFTFYTHWGDWFPLGIAIFLGYGLLKDRRKGTTLGYCISF